MVFRRVVPAVIVLLILVVLSPTAAPKFSEWSAPVNLGAVVNSPGGDAAPALSKDGRSLYFNSNRPGGFGAGDLYVSQRESTDAAWGGPINLGAVINSTAIESVPELSRDGHWLFFNSNRPGSLGGLDIWVSYRQHVDDDFDWQTPVILVPIVNSAVEDNLGGFFENEGAAPLLFLGSNRPGGPGLFDFYVSEMQSDGTFGPPVVIPELSSPLADPGLMVGFNGLEAFFFSARAGGVGGQDLWTATRQAITDLWSAPTNLGPLVNSTVIDQRPYLGSDRGTLYFASDRGGGYGGLDLYLTTRTKN